MADQHERSTRHQRLRTVFDQAVLHDPATRARHLDEACAGDPQLRREVERLLAAHADAVSFLEQPVTLPEPLVGDDVEFSGTERFTVLRRLGAGGMGVVYEVFDKARNELVALKTFQRAAAADLYRLKREFRSLTDVSHPNLICLYELIVDGERGMFTMELVRGVTFVEYVRQGAQRRLSLERLRSTLRQLVDGVEELHRVGKLHRDIKPSNVLVTAKGRVVILDFGLVEERFAHGIGSGEHLAGGTPAYTAPEEGEDVPLTGAVDWYSVGATLYEALTGQVPFNGASRDVLRQKRECDPLAPASVDPDVPADLSAMCLGLMCRDPSRRWSGRDVLMTLAGVPAGSPTLARETPADSPFVGRTRELAVLERALHMVSERTPASVYLCGPSGIGKSALMRAFLSALRRRDDVVVLSGRCYEHESVPYKALDGVIDSLSRHLAALPESVSSSLIPEDAAAIPRLFPVMLQVPSIARASRERSLPASEPFVLRRRAFEALRELLARIGDRCRLVIAIDDLHWADSDGVQLLEELLATDSPPVLLMLVSFRSEEVAHKPFLRRIASAADRPGWTPLVLEPLPQSDAVHLVDALVPTDSVLGEDERARITREAGGSPFVLEQLARFVATRQASLRRAPSFAELFETRLNALPPDARHFLEALAICGRPVDPDLLCRACDVVRARQALVAMLRSSHLIRSSGSSERVETYHDRIRDVVVAQIRPDSMRGIHHRMVMALVAEHSDDCEALFEHYRGAGNAAQAATQAALAAAKAGSALAFDRAASFYREAMALAPDATTVNEWKEGLATALANAGRPEEAAAAYLDAAAGAPHATQIDLQRRAAEQWLVGGHIDRGLALVRTALAGVGVRPASGPRTALLGLLWRRAQLRWRGLAFVSKSSQAVDPAVLRRIDTCWSATTGLALVDMITAADLSARHLLMALDAGDPSRIARGFAMESAARCAYPSGRTMSDRLMRESRVLASSLGEPQTTALSLLADGLIALATGQFKRTLSLSGQALPILRDECVGLTWEMNIAQNLVIWAQMYLGELREVARQVPVLLAQARSRGNLFVATELCTRANFAWLAVDNPDEGEREAIDSIGRWSRGSFYRQHYSAMLARVQTALYRGNAAGASRLLDEEASLVQRSGLTRVQLIRIELLYLRARCALAMAATGIGGGPFLSIARRNARRIAREQMPWSTPIARLIEAGVACQEAEFARACALLHEAADGFARADMALYVAVTRRLIGALQDDERGRDLRRLADAWMADQHIRNPAAMTRMLAPGLPDVPAD
jgi:hypothetical protein